MEHRLPVNVALLTADRFSPWNGTRLDEPDHIWADFPALLGVPLLLFRENTTSSSIVNYRFGEVLETTEGRPTRWRTALLVVQSIALSLRYGSRLLLGVRPVLVASRVKRALLRQPSPGDLTRWHRAVLQLSRHLRRNSVDVLVFHGEFDAWGTTVVWACRRAGVRAVAHQHYAMPKTASHYRRVGRLGRFAPDGLLCVSRFQQDLWSDLPLSVAYGGSRRPTWNLSAETAPQGERIADLLLVPSVGDTAQIQREAAAHPDRVFHVRPHPGRMEGWNLPNVRLHSENLVDLLGRFDAVVTSSPSPTVTLTAARQPFVKMRGHQPDGTCPCAERRVFTSVLELLAALERSESLTGLVTLGCSHNLTDPPSREEYLRAISHMLCR